MGVTIGQRAESLSVGVGADNLLVRHHPGRGVVHLGEGEAHGSAGGTKLKANTLLAVFASDSSICVLPLFVCLLKKERV